jgi:tetratricopeptide (TPR) repeat protein
VSRSIVHVRRKKKDADPLRSAWHILEDWLEFNRQRIVVIGGITVGLVALVALGYYFFDYRGEQRQAAFAAAFEKFTATVGTAPATPGMPAAKKVNYETEEAKYTDAGAAFEQLANDYSAYHDIGRYYAGLSYLKVQPDKGIGLLEPLASGSSDARYESRLALAEHFDRAGDYAKAEQYYQQLADDPGKFPRFYILNQLGQVKERLSKPAEAAPLYRVVIDADRNSAFGVEAEKGLQRVDPVAAAALPPKAAPTGPAPYSAQPSGGGMPINLQ